MTMWNRPTRSGVNRSRVRTTLVRAPRIIILLLIGLSIGIWSNGFAQTDCQFLFSETKKSLRDYDSELKAFREKWSPDVLENIERLKGLPGLLDRLRSLEDSVGKAKAVCGNEIFGLEETLNRLSKAKEYLILSIFVPRNLTAEALGQVASTPRKDKSISLDFHAMLGIQSERTKEKFKKLTEALEEKRKICLTVARSLRPDEVNIRNSKGATLLMNAAKSGELELVKELLSREVDVQARDHDGNTAIHEAAATGSKPIIELLLARGADLYAKNKKEETALHAAVNNLSHYRHMSVFYDYGHVDLIAWLREKKLITDPKELIALHTQAVEKRNLLMLDPYVDRGDAYLYLKEYDHAIEDYRKALDEADSEIGVYAFFFYKKPYVYSQLGASYRGLKDYDRAVEAYSKAIEIHSTYLNAYWGRGHVRYDKKENDEAIADYELVTQLAPKFAPGYEYLGFAYHDKGDLAKAVQMYTIAERLGSKNANVYQSRGDVFYKQKKYEEAIRDYLQVNKLSPDYLPAYEQQGFAYHNKGETAKALEMYTKAEQLGSKNADVYQSRGNIYNSEKKYDEAIADYLRVLKLAPDYLPGFEQLGFAYHNKGDTAKAVEMYTKAEQLGSKNANVYHSRGDIFSNEKKYDQAITDFLRVTELAPEYSNGYGLLGWYLILQGKFEEAKKPTQKAYELAPKDYAWAVNLGHIYLLTGHEEKAMDLYHKALPLVDDDASFQAGPMADFDIFIKNGWKVKEATKYKSWMLQEWKKYNK